ncbi:MAG TPA: HTH-type transcriptional activator IlvY [Acidimicrobiales bacterium]|nr:HTH-type transcriptional activator IlvY [Acidimicrobiales bacterium]
MREYEPLRQFVELAHSLHFGRAARACHVSPSTLSRSIQRLEAEVGEPLFEREHHSVTLTPAGEAFRRHALAVLEEWQRFSGERAPAHGELTGTLHVYCTVTAAQSIVPDVLARVRAQHPGIRIELATGYAADAVDQLRGGDIDVTIAALPDRLPSGIVSRILTTTRVVFVAPSQGPVFDAAMRRPLDWAALPMVLPAFGLAREYVDQWFAERDIDPLVYAQIQGHEAILSLVALGCGVGVVPRLVLEKSALRDHIVEVPVRPMLRSFRIGLCVRERSLSSPLVGAVWDAAR